MSDWEPDIKREGSVMCRFCLRQIQRCICSGPNNTPLDTGPNAIAKLPHITQEERDKREKRAADILNSAFTDGTAQFKDGISLNSAPHPDDFTVKRLADAIKDGRLSLTRKKP